MKVINIPKLYDYWEKHPQTKKSLQAFLSEVDTAKWKTPNDLKRSYPGASIISSKTIVIDIRGNNNRLVIRVQWQEELIAIEFIGTHKEYDELKLE